MNIRTHRKNYVLIVALAAAFILMATMLMTDKAEAANIKKAKPKFIVSKCQFANPKAELAWKKVKGAKKYQVFFSKKKSGKYKLFANSKKTKVAKKSVGEFYYKVRALDGKKASKLSAAVHLFPAKGNVYDTMTITTTFFFGGSVSSTFYDVAVKNNSKKPMKFDTKDGHYFIVAKEKKTGKTEESEASLINEDPVTVKAGKTEKFSVRSGTYPGSYPSEEYDLFVKAKFKAGGKAFTMYFNYSDMSKTTVGAISK